VGQRPSSEIIQSLRATLQKLEEGFASVEDQPVMAELKRILLLRIADMEFVTAAVEMVNAENQEPVAQETRHDDIVPPLVVEDGPESTSQGKPLLK
jgi:hypothetical protein